MINSGWILLGIGMGIVCAFLVILIFSLKCMSWVITKFFPEVEVPTAAKKTSTNNDVDIAIAIAAVRSLQ